MDFDRVRELLRRRAGHIDQVPQEAPLNQTETDFSFSSLVELMNR